MKILSFTTLSLALFLVGCQSQGVKIPYQKIVSLEVGESAIIHGFRGKCNQSPPSWEVISSKLPTILTGEFSDGGIGVRGSRSCGGPTPAQAIRFTATQPGIEDIVLFGDPINIEVK